MARILYAEDSESLRKTLGFLLRRKGHEVDEVASGNELLNRLESGTYDLVISDNDMPPGMSGLMVLGRIRADDRYRQLPFILFSANLDAGKKAEELGAVYLDKSAYSSTALHAAIEKLTAR